MLALFLTLLDSDEENTKFEQLYYRYRNLLHYVAKGILQDNHLAEDAVSEAFLRVAKNFSKIGEVDSPQNSLSAGFNC